MHVSTKRLSKLSKNKKDEFFQSLGLSINEIYRIRKLPPKDRILEAARIALSVDPAPNSDFIEWLAGYSWRGALYHYYKNLNSLLVSVNAKYNSQYKKPSPIAFKENQFDLLNFIPENIKDSKVWIDSEDTYLYIW
jgi:hypothetical protein